MAQVAPAQRLYLVTTETGMPHLDENLRYAVRREERCLDPADLSQAFWILDHVALQGCRLVGSGGASRYALRCNPDHGTTGQAEWQLDEPGLLRGRLDVRLGGKNMTFFQSILARELGPCPRP